MLSIGYTDIMRSNTSDLHSVEDIVCHRKNKGKLYLGTIVIKPAEKTSHSRFGYYNLLKVKPLFLLYSLCIFNQILLPNSFSGTGRL